MSQPYVGEVILAGFNFAPSGFLYCDGSLLSISEYEVLFVLIGTTYGGDGQTTFAVPDLRGRVPVHQGTGYVMGQMGGQSSVTLTSLQLPNHTHTLACQTAAGTVSTGAGHYFAGDAANLYAVPGTQSAMSTSLAAYGNAGTLAHDNMQPYLAIGYYIAYEGIFPEPELRPVSRRSYSLRSLSGDRSMSTPYLGQLQLMSYSFAPKGYAFCNGQLMSISQNQALFALLGTTFGGNGTTTFALPNLQGCVAVHASVQFTLGVSTGVANYTLQVGDIPLHTHLLSVANTSGTLSTPVGNTVGTDALNPYDPASTSIMSTQAISPAGGSVAHENESPYTVLNWVIALSGIFPSRN